MCNQHRSVTGSFAPTGLNEIAQGRAKRHPGSYAIALGKPTARNAGTVPAFFLFTIGGSAPGAFRLVLGLGELCAFAVNLGRLWTARFDTKLGDSPRAVG
jgi:hypothetical protein